MSSTNFITFKTSNKTPEMKTIDSDDDGNDKTFLEQLCKFSIPYKKNHCTEVLQSSFLNSKTTRFVNNGFVNTVVSCYNQHHNLVLRPDDVWTAIMVQFSFYINKEAEKYRGKFVNFEGKKELTVVIPVSSIREVSYNVLAKLMAMEIDNNLVDPEVKSWILPSFSTTTREDLVVCSVVFMATMKKYFNYRGMLMCGIPNVTLQGTVEDWENLAKRLGKLKDYDLTWWYDLLKSIVEEMVEARKGNASTDFWRKICHYIPGGSGPTYVSGWISAFCVFDEDGNKKGQYGELPYAFRPIVKALGPWLSIDTKHIPGGSVHVDVKMTDLEGQDHDTVMFAGHIGQEALDGGVTLKPVSGWVMCLKRSAEEIRTIKKEKKCARKAKYGDDYSRRRMLGWLSSSEDD